MEFLDRIQAGVKRAMPSKNESIPALGVGHGFGAPDEDMIVSKPAIIFHSGQIFFNFLALCCFASVAAFQSKWKIGVSGLSGFAIFISLLGILYSAFILLVPVFYEKYDKFSKLARALREVRVNFILTSAGVGVSLLIAFITTISAWTEPGCKNPDNDPHAKEGGDDFTNALPGWCDTKKAGAVFFWLAFGFWLASIGLAIWDWRTGRTTLPRPRDPPFVPPSEQYDPQDDDDDDEVRDRATSLNNIPAAPRRETSDASDANPASPFSDRYGGGGGYNPPYAAATSSPSGGGGYGGYTDSMPAPRVTSEAPVLPMPRTSMDTYGAFNDPPPSGFGGGFSSSSPGPGSPTGVSRTMQYADPYAAVRSQITQGAPQNPPGYDGYSGYR